MTTTQYDTAGDFELKKEKLHRKRHWEYHIVFVLGLQIILAVFCTPGNMYDSKMLLPMLDMIKHL